MDSINILPTALSAFNKMEFDYSLLEKGKREQNMPIIREYLKSDCINLFDYISEFFKHYPKSLTLAGCAFKVWREMSNIQIPKTDQTHYLAYRDYYYGGRVECFRVGTFKGNYKIIDINSAYPRAMLERHPWNTKTLTSFSIPENAIDLCFIKVRGHNHGALPFRDDKGKVTYEKKHGVFTCTGHELRVALETNTFVPEKIIKVIRFRESITFRDYVNRFYELKHDCEKRGDKPGRLFAKLFLNSLYGKMASNPDEYRDWKIKRHGSATINDLKQGWQSGSIIGDMQLFSRPANPDFAVWYNVATGASITGWVRAFLWQSINKVSNPIYCDTDSIVCADTGNLALSENIGDWSLEMDVNKIAIAGKKLYCAISPSGEIKKASKGARLSADDIFDVASGKTVTYKSDAPTFSLSLGNHFVKRDIVKAEKASYNLIANKG